MSSASVSLTRRSLALASALSLCAAALALAGSGNSPAVPVEQVRWGEMEPRAILGDTTFYSGQYEPGCNEPYWFDLDVEAGVLFTATGSSLEVWDARQDAGEPSLASDLCRPVLGQWKKTDENWYLKTIDAPPGDPSVAIAGSSGGMGVLILRVPTPGNAAVFYQDEGRLTATTGEILSISSVVALEPASTAYGFALTIDSRTIKMYDLDKVKTLTSTCREGTQDGNISCPGVYVGTLRDGGSDVTATAIAGAGRYLVTTFGADLRIFDVTQPGAATKVAAGTVPVAASAQTSAQLAAWMQGSQLYFAIATRSNLSKQIDVFEVPCIGSASCQPQLVNSLVLDSPSPVNLLSASVDGGIPYLYAGSESVRGVGPQREFLFDMSNPIAPTELTPDHPDGYWGWYYEENDGFNNVAPYVGKVWNGHLYRGAWSLLDVHALIGNVPPGADFELPPSPVYANTNVTFEDRSTRSPNSWSWTFDAPSIVVDSTQQNPSWLIPVEGPFPRDYVVELEACNDAGCDTASKTMTVQDPVPNGQVFANVTSITQCGTVTFEADVSGKPPLSFSWDVETSQGASLGETGSGSVFSWSVPATQTPGNYRGVVAASNTVEGQGTSVELFSPLVAVVALPQLAVQSASASAPDLGTVDFSVFAEGATRWLWDFDGDGVFDLDTTDPNEGPNPTYSYTEVGTYTPRVRVENCRDGGITYTFESSVFVDEVVRLEARAFEAQVCSPFGCFASLNQEIAFSVEIGGNPDQIVVDWGDDKSDTYSGSVLDANGRATLFHSYTTAAQSVGYVPSLTATRGGQSVERLHGTTPSDPPGTPGAQIFVASTSQPASVTVSGPSSVSSGQVATFRATVNNCSPAPTGWSWSTSGAQIQGPSDGDTIQLSWALTGTKTVRATAQGGGCSGTRGSRNVTVSGGGGGGGGGGPSTGSLSAEFSLSEASPAAGQTVTFDASASSGGVESYYWDFGDGRTFGPSPSPTVEHVYDEPGDYKVMLEVSKASQSCALGLCTASTDAVVTVEGEAEPPLVLEARIEVLSESPTVGSAVLFAADVSSSDVASAPAADAYFWDFGDGLTLGPGNHPNPAHVFAQPGSYTVSLEVSYSDPSCPLGLCTASDQRTIEVVQDATCPDDPSALCLLGQRYEVRLDYTTSEGESRTAQPVPAVGSDQAGLFYFSRPGNWEVLVKLVDGCQFNQHRWVFASWSSDLALALEVTDRVTGTSRTYFKPGGVSAPAESDFEAFACDGNDDVARALSNRAGAGGLEPKVAIDNVAPAVGDVVKFDASASLGSPTHFYWDFGDGAKAGPITDATISHQYSQPGTYRVLLEISKSSGTCDFGICSESTVFEITVAGASDPPDDPPVDDPPVDDPPGDDSPEDEEPTEPEDDGSCQDGDTSLCLLNGRFEVSLEWIDDQGELTDARVVPFVRTDQSGLFYFRREANWESLVKMVDGCSFNGHFWVFASAATELPVNLTFTDTQTGEQLTFVHGGGGPAPSVADLDAFAGCDATP